MPTADQILDGLREIANAWEAISIFWHIYFGILVGVLAIGIRPSRRFAGVLIALPFLSVSASAWLLPNPVNGVIFAVVGIVLLIVAAKLPSDRVQIARGWPLILGAFLFLFGWIYPHFLDTSSYLPYLYAAPIGIIPCPTLILAIGSVLILDGLGSRRLNTILGVVGLFYGIMGVAYLHMALDGALILGTGFILIYSSRKIWNPR